MNIEQKITESINEIKDLYQNDGKLDSSMSDLNSGKIQAFRQVLDWMKDTAEDEINAALSDIRFDEDGNALLPEDDLSTQEEEGNVKEGDI